MSAEAKQWNNMTIPERKAHVVRNAYSLDRYLKVTHASYDVSFNYTMDRKTDDPATNS